MHTGIRWLIVGGYLLTLPFMRRGWDLVRTRGGDPAADALPLAAGLALVAALAWYLVAKKREVRISVYLLLAGVCGVSAALFCSLREPIMRIHIAQYALMSIFVFWAMEGEREGWTFCLWAALVTSELGLADESFQGLLPSRIYDLQDVFLNVKAAILGQAVVLLVLRPWESHGRAPRPAGERNRAAFTAIAFSLVTLLALLNIALIEKGTPTLGGWGNAVVKGRDGFRFFGAAAVAANAVVIIAASILAAAGGPLRGAARALRAAAVCGLLSPLILIAGRLLGMRFR
ncbi:MAG: VanZ family protein [Chlamydiota bacterium]